MKDIGKKWRDSRIRLYDKLVRKQKTFEENLSKCPLRISKDDWAEYLTYRNKQKTMVFFCCFILLLLYFSAAVFFCCCFCCFILLLLYFSAAVFFCCCFCCYCFLLL